MQSHETDHSGRIILVRVYLPVGYARVEAVAEHIINEHERNIVLGRAPYSRPKPVIEVPDEVIRDGGFWPGIGRGSVVYEFPGDYFQEEFIRDERRIRERSKATTAMQRFIPERVKRGAQWVAGIFRR